jgi:UDP-N-acetylglucosamine 1-carboxyvinyltransferase
VPVPFEPEARRRLVVRPSAGLQGSVLLQGAKNSVLKLLAATLLAPGRHELERVPRITDVDVMCAMLSAMGCETAWTGASSLEVVVPDEVVPETPPELAERIRASIVVLGPLLGRAGRARLCQPGGDDFGKRPIDMHLRALGELGAVLEVSQGFVEGKASRLKGRRIVLEYPSHTATDNVLMASVLAEGTTVIENAAREPEVVDLATMLVEMGADVEGAGTSRLVVHGVDRLRPVAHRVIPDRVEAATYLVAVGLAGGRVEVVGACPEHMDMLLAKLAEIGLELEASEDGLVVSQWGRPRSVDVATLPYPGVATDYKPLLVVLLSVASGVAVVSENLFLGRFRYVDDLRRMGADIVTDAHHAVVRGVERLQGARVRAHDIRAGAALALAGLVADGETVVEGAEHIARGYEHFAEKLCGLGADVVEEPAG